MPACLNDSGLHTHVIKEDLRPWKLRYIHVGGLDWAGRRCLERSYRFNISRRSSLISLFQVDLRIATVTMGAVKLDSNFNIGIPTS